jgi:hypothetical protein
LWYSVPRPDYLKSWAPARPLFQFPDECSRLPPSTPLLVNVGNLSSPSKKVNNNECVVKTYREIGRFDGLYSTPAKVDRPQQRHQLQCGLRHFQEGVVSQAYEFHFRKTEKYILWQKTETNNNNINKQRDNRVSENKIIIGFFNWDGSMLGVCRGYVALVVSV